ncbi:MAG: acyltransferase [Candidatus Cryptobacteroides sp.]|nr:acyltransferase [Bacteroidales bacterium]MDY6157840.1 acyltransferase [Candidatus Cryptobacteroides sp.]
MSSTANAGRIAFVDYIRVAACFLVMLVHASENFYGADSSGLAGNMSMLANESNRFWVAFYDGFVGRVCVPLFMIVSAFLLVPMKPGTSMGAFYKKRFTRILPPMICFMLLYTFLPLLWGGMSPEQSWADFKMLPFNFPSMAGHLWFMYPLISLYLIIPVVSPWLERASAKEELGFLGIFGVSTLIPWIHRFITPELWGECFWNGFTMLWYFSGYLGYLVMAHYIRYHLHWERRKRAITGAACFLVGAAFTGWSFWYMGTPGKLIETPLLEWSWEFCTPNVLLASFGAFLLFSCIERKSAPAAVSGIAKLSFGMYLMHMFFLAPIAKLFIGGSAAEPLVPVYLAIPCIALCTFICCVLTTKLISLIPGSKWIVGC